MRAWITVIALLIVLVPATSVYAADGSVTICHRPPGNRGNAKELTVEFESAVDHLAHGDSVGQCLPLLDVPAFETFDCDNWKDYVFEGEDIVFQHGIGFGTLDEALAEREGEQVFFKLNGALLEPVFYEGITVHSPPDFYGDRGRVRWTPVDGTYTLESWWSHPNEGLPADVCTFTVNAGG